MFSIRKADENDAAAVAILFSAYRQFYNMPEDVSAAEHFIAARLHHHESVIFVAEDDGEMIGFCQIYSSFCSVFIGKICILNDLFVAPQKRGVGAGLALLKAAEAFATESDAVRITLQTSFDNHRAQALYEGQGWNRNTTLYGYAKLLT